MSYQTLFSMPGSQDTTFFYEGPKPPKNPTVASLSLSGTMDTSAIDGWRQGVELTQQKHFDAGTVKIWAGEPGHTLRQTRFGMDKNLGFGPKFQDADRFNPVTYIAIQDHANNYSLLNDVMTFPIITSDNDQSSERIADGIIEPLTIRAKAAFFSIDSPFESHEIKGAVMGGNLDMTKASSLITSLDYFNVKYKRVPYIDNVNMFGSSSTGAQFDPTKSVLLPFADTRMVRNVIPSTTYNSDLTSALTLMTGSTDNYVTPNKVSSTNGWNFDNNVNIGTDSIAFGGQVH
jgi:hypothetical protein